MNIDYKLIEDLLEQAKANEQHLIFRLLPHSTRARDDVSDWLMKLIPCQERPEGKRVKDSPTDPLFLELFENAICKIGERFDVNPRLDIWKKAPISFEAYWWLGEWKRQGWDIAEKHANELNDIGKQNLETFLKFWG